MPNLTRRAVAIVAIAAAIVAGAVALELPSAAAQSDDETGRIVARRLDDGRTEFGWQPSGGARVLPTARYFPADAQVPEGEQVGRWLNSSPVVVEEVAIGRINARLHADGRIEFAFTPTDRERILTDARYFPAAPRPNRWLRSTEITLGPLVRYVAVSAGIRHSCAIREDGAITCWGWNEYGQTDTPTGSFSAVSAGADYTCAIAETFETAVSNAGASGEIECWGQNSFGQADAPTGNFTAVATGGEHACALRESGAIRCWGGRPGWPQHAHDNPPPAGSFTAIAVGISHNCAIRESDSAIVCWGNYAGYTPTGSFSAVSAGSQHTCAIRAESSAIECWGDNQYGQTNAPEGGSFTAVSAGDWHTCAIWATSDGIECWGSNASGQTYNWGGSFTAVSASFGHNCAIRDDGVIVCWGRNDEGQTDAPAQ